MKKLYTAEKKKKKKSKQNLACSQRQMHTVHTCKLSQAKNYQMTLVPLKYKQPLPTRLFPKVQLYTVFKCRNIYRVYTEMNARAKLLGCDLIN